MSAKYTVHAWYDYDWHILYVGNSWIAHKRAIWNSRKFDYGVVKVEIRR